MPGFVPILGEDDPRLRPQVNVGDAPPVPVDPEAQRRVLMSVQPPADPMQDPAFRAYVAKQAQAQAELRAAQQQAAERRGSTSFRVGNAMMAFGGAGPEELNARYEQAGQGVKDVLARQAAEAAGTKQAQEETALGGEMFKSGQAREAASPGSPLSKAHAMLALHQGLIKPEDVGTYTASMDDALHKGATIQQAREHAKAQIAIETNHLALEGRKADETHRHNVVEESFLGQKDIPPAAVTELESKLDAVKALDDLKAQKGNSGFIDKALSAIGFGDYEQTKNAVSAEVAKADAKGRTNPSGAIREKQMLPGAFQNDTGIDQKRKQLIGEAERHLATLKAGRVRPGQVDEYQRQIDQLKAGSAPGGGSSATPAGFAGYRYSKDRKTRFPSDANGNRLGPNEAVNE